MTSMYCLYHSGNSPAAADNTVCRDPAPFMTTTKDFETHFRSKTLSGEVPASGTMGSSS